ncbi:MAG: DUF167 domain-containing protein [Verrucomicrobiae bacterium]|nr:DUF167 domain-containing protein [Verrucomicrobiae bacterium]
MSLPECLQACPEGARIRLKAQPRAKRNEVGDLSGPEVTVRVTAPPVDSAANEAILRLLAETLRCRRGDLQLVRGQTSRHKVVLVAGLSPEEVVKRWPPPA